MGGLDAYTLDESQNVENSGIVTSVNQLSVPFEVPPWSTSTIECVARWVSKLLVTQLEVITLASAFLNISTYALWWRKPHKMNVPFFVRVQDIPREAWTSSKGIGPFYSPVQDISPPEFVAAACLIVIPFGGIHLIPKWLSSFPSPREKYLWIISSIWTTARHTGLADFKILESKNYWRSLLFRFLYEVATPIMLICARIILIYVAFTSLRNPSEEVFYSINWSSFLPHFN
ncbi:hypothetical protein NP233_g11181 [Leucocoprinus birnbaumii]|uniref:Uncharacterized protein n=1 Tax=Leucocoprinus birnbaumii TaxID=56174 RepID=A0AAD5VH10_9AGAR|nr:hypothetical protein NP233_g11181 [Leucocoprinus birnbaumii]